jgi:preprotein translocase subunit SecA
MGLFDFLFASKQQSSVQVLDDRIWMTQNAKLSGIKQQIRQSSDSAAILLVAHFEETLQQLRSMIADYHTATSVQLILAEDLESDTARLNPEENSVIDLIIAERHPLKSADDALLLIAESLPCRCRVAYHLSLEDPLFKHFLSGSLETILEQLGMKENEPIESPLITRSVKGAQQKIEKQAFGNSRAKSAAEWLELNIPNS